MKTKILDLYEGQISPWQQAAVSDPHRFLVLVCGRKARKTTFMINRLAKLAMTDKAGLTYPYFAPFRKQAKQIVWDDHIARILKKCNEFGIRYRLNQSDLTVRFEGGGKLQVDGMDNAEAHRGKSDWGYVAVDEAASTRLRYIWQEIIRPNLQVHKAGGVIGGTPKGYDDFYDMAKWGDHQGLVDEKAGYRDVDFQTFHATSYDNPFNDPEEIEAAKRSTNPDYFRREYLAEFIRFSGLVYPEFDYKTHVEDLKHDFNEHGDYYFGMDFALRGYTAIIVGKVKTNGHIYLLDEYKMPGKTAKQHVEEMKDVLEKYADLDKYVGYADPAGWIRGQQNKDMFWAIADEYTEEGLPLTKGNNEVVAGINYVRQLLINERIHISQRCEQLIAEFYQYQWKEQSPTQEGRIEEPEKVRKINDHLLDALRYMVYSKPMAPDEEEHARNTIFPARFEMKLDVEEENKDNFQEIQVPSLYDN